MSDLPTSARAVVIGAGIVGNSICYHLSELGWSDLVLLDKGPFPNPGGSTGHASNFIFPVDHSKEMTALTLDSVRQYQDLDVFTESGGIEVARTEERMGDGFAQGDPAVDRSSWHLPMVRGRGEAPDTPMRPSRSGRSLVSVRRSAALVV